MSIRTLLLYVVVTGVLWPSPVFAQARLLWDEPDNSGVTGFAVTIDGTRTDYGMTPVGSGGFCGCAVPFPFTSGSHTVIVSAYGPGGEASTAPIVLTLGSPSTSTTSTGSGASSTTTASALPAPWSDVDVGAVGATGSAATSGSIISIAGGGADIWGTADAFNFAFQPVAGDGSIVARVTSLQKTNAYAKAGVMWRGTAQPGSPHVILDARPDGSLEFMTRAASGGATTFVAGSAESFPVWLKLARSGGSVVGSASSDGITWTQVGSAATALGASAETGLAVTSHAAGTLNTAAFDHVSIGTSSPQASPALAAPWTSADVGTTGVPGSASQTAAGAFSVSGAGADIWGSSDAFEYVSQPIAGDTQMVARVTSLEDTSPYAKAGVMLRSSTSAIAADVILDAKPDGSIEFMARPADGGATAYLGGAAATFPAWLKLVRRGSATTGYVSADGTTWTAVGVATTSIGSAARVGLAVTSHDAAVAARAAFDNVAVSALAASDVVVYAGDVPASSRHGSWTLAADPTATGGMKLATPDTGFAATSSALASPSNYVDVTFNAVAATPYRVWLRLRALDDSKYNDSVWLQFSDALAGGVPAYRIGSSNGLVVNLASDSTGGSLNGWGWANGAYWLTQQTSVTFGTSGSHTLRIQVREDGVAVDQIVLSPVQFLNAAPGPASADTTIVAKP